MRKQPFSLIEMMIALGLLGLLMTSLFFWYQNLATRSKDRPASFQKKTQEYYAFHQLERVFAHLAPPLGSTHTYFYTERNSLGNTDIFFTYDHGTDREPAFSGVLLATLHIENRQLALTIWPHPQYRDAMAPRTQILFPEVSQCSFRGLAPRTATTLFVSSHPVGIPPIQPGWHTEWPLEWNQLPGLIHITLTGQQEYCWIFDSNQPILYCEEQAVPASWEGML